MAESGDRQILDNISEPNHEYILTIYDDRCPLYLILPPVHLVLFGACFSLNYNAKPIICHFPSWYVLSRYFLSVEFLMTSSALIILMAESLPHQPPDSAKSPAIADPPRNLVFEFRLWRMDFHHSNKSNNISQHDSLAVRWPGPNRQRYIMPGLPSLLTPTTKALYRLSKFSYGSTKECNHVIAWARGIKRY